MENENIGIQTLRLKSKQITSDIKTKGWVSFGSVIDDYHLYYQPVSFMWNKFGYKTFYTLICQQNSIQVNKYGVVLRLKKIDTQKIFDNRFGRDYCWQAQISRLYASSFISGIMITSDSDSMPLQEYYFDELVKRTKNKIAISRKSPYHGQHKYCMMWTAADSQMFQDIFKSKCQFSDFCINFKKEFGDSFIADQIFLTKYIDISGYEKNFMDDIKVQRIDRANWNYDKNLLKTGYYTDSHLLRPFIHNKYSILKLIKDRFV